MLNTKLILIEGLPGSGKSTLTQRLGADLRQRGIPCCWFCEEDQPHPLVCLDFEIPGLAEKMIPLWQSLVAQANPEPSVTIIESRLWQNTALFMFMSECPIAEIVDFHRAVYQTLTPLAPALLYLFEADIDAALGRLTISRGTTWLEREMATTTEYPWFQRRGLTDFSGWVQIFTEWQQVARQLFDDWPFHKTLISNAHADWQSAYRNIYTFLKV